MALFIILAGVLLMLGGASFLLSGFDIVMTERGSAMTIGGTIALSGGVIAVGIGFSLLRLSQILAALESAVIEEEPENAKELVSTEPVIVSAPFEAPKAVVEAPLLEPAKKPLPEEDTILISPLARKDAPAEPKRPGFLRSSSLAKAGVVTAGAAAIAAGISKASATDKAEDASEPLDLPVEPPKSIDTIVEKLDLSGSDLDDALSKALAEDLEKPEIIAEVSKDNDFNAGLSEILSKPRKRSKKVIEAFQAESEDISLDDIAAKVSEDAKSALPVLAQPDIEIAKTEAQEISEEPTDETTPEPDLQEMKSQDVDAEQPEVAGPSILGTYNADNGTYIMYSDGTVEAITEQGVRKFKSMEELRSHLAKS